MSAVVVNRKPLPAYPQGAPQATYNVQTQYLPAQDRTHTRTRTNSSAAVPFPSAAAPTARPPSSNMAHTYSITQQYPQSQLQRQLPPQQHQSRDPSRRSFSNSSLAYGQPNSANLNLQRVSTNSNASIAPSVRRSTSSRSGGANGSSPTSYVSLMRKQKATVWCDRAQHEDPRILAAQRHAKQRAAAEVAGGHSLAPTSARVSTGSSLGVRSKIRGHHGAMKASAFNAGALRSNDGVPVRLSATEVDENDSGDESSMRYHTRNGSGRSSMGSGRKGPFTSTPSDLNTSSNPAYGSAGSTPSSGVHSPGTSHAQLRNPYDPHEEHTPIPDSSRDDYFGAPSGGSEGSGHSYSTEAEESFGQIAGLPNSQTSALVSAQQQVEKRTATADELRRRGSVDDRTMTLSAGRLFVANPDLSD